MARVKLSDSERKKRDAEREKARVERAKIMASESPEQREQRIAKEKIAKKAKFRELGERRLTSALHRIKLCGNLAAYKPSAEQITWLHDELQTAVNQVRLRLNAQKAVQTLTPCPV